MISTIREIIRFINIDTVNIWTVLLFYFWSVWSIKLICSMFYRPIKSDFISPVSIIITAYHEDKDILSETISKALQYPEDIVTEVIVVTDQRELNVSKELKIKYADEKRIKIIIVPPGKRGAIDAGVRLSNNEIVVLIDSDTFLNEKTIYEIIKPFSDSRIGGVVSDQHIHNPYVNLINFFNELVESIKFHITISALSVFGSVTVLAGRCAAYRKCAIIDLLPDLVDEKFLGKKCVSGDDGRLTSLVLRAGWRTVYQSTATVSTIAPPTWYGLVRQRLRWNRNTSRRTIRALLCFDGIWVWKRPAAFFQMILTWTNSIMMGIAIYTIIGSIISTSWFWFGRTWTDITLRFGVFFFGVMLTRLVRIYPIIKHHNTRKWLWFPLFPFYLMFMWIVRVYAILTMNKQGWITRKENGAGGFDNISSR